jgi:hypothetical protein
MSTTLDTVDNRPVRARTTARATRRDPLTSHATLWVAVLVWVLPLAGFTAAAVGDPQGEVVLLGVMTVVLLIPVGLVALVLVRALPCLGWRPPAFVLGLASSLGGALAGGVLVLLGDLLT